MRTLRAAFANRDIALLEASWAGVTLARWALTILVGLYAYREGGAGAVGVAAFARTLPAVVIAPRLALTVDRRSRRAVLLVTTPVRAALVVGLTLVVAADVALAVLLVLAAAYACVDSVQSPAQGALLPLFARNPSELAASNALWSMIENASFVLGAALTGVLVATVGLTAAFAVLVAPLVVATVVLVPMTADRAVPPLGEPQLLHDIAAGAVTVTRDPGLRLTIGLDFADVFVQAMTDVLFVVIAVGVLDLGAQGAGWLSAAWGCGGVVGGAIASTLFGGGRLAAGVLTGLLLVGVTLVVVGIWPQAVVALIVFIGLGIGFGMVEVGQLTLGQRLVAADVLGRVYGVQETLRIIATAMGSLAAAALVAGFGQRVALIVTGALLPVLALAIGTRLFRLGSGSVADAAIFEVLRGVPAFAGLPVATVESVALRAERVAFHHGEDVVRQGDPGDTFFVIESGSADVFENGEFRRSENAGDFFGEIALMQNVRRTATVRATSRLQLIALERDAFLAAVGSHPRAAHEMRAAVSGRLVGAEDPTPQ